MLKIHLGSADMIQVSGWF